MGIYKSLAGNYKKLPGLVLNKFIPDSYYFKRFLKGKKTLNNESGARIISRQIKRNYGKHRPLGNQRLICYAPSKSMYFGISGNVRACCRNESYIYGSYPLQTIREIWNGEKVGNLRQRIRQNDLSPGCEECYKHLSGSNFSAVVAKMFDTQKMNRNYPSVMEFELDNTCNLECKICAGRLSSSIRKNREKIPHYITPYDSDFVAQLEEFIPHLEEARFYGGEPFLIKLYYEIWELIIRINPRIKIYVQTNGTVLTEKIKNLIENGRFVINVSIDAMDKQLFEKLRVGANFDFVMENLMYFYQYSRRKKTFFCITPTLMRDNWQELPKLISFCNSLDIPLFYNTLYSPRHLALNNLPENELKRIADELASFTFKTESKTQKQNLFYYNDFFGLVRKWERESSARKAKSKDELLSIEQARKQLHEYIHQYLENNKEMQAKPTISEDIDRVIYLFDQEEEQRIIYNKLLKIPVIVIIERVKAITNMDDPTIMEMVREYL